MWGLIAKCFGFIKRRAKKNPESYLCLVLLVGFFIIRPALSTPLARECNVFFRNKREAVKEAFERLSTNKPYCAYFISLAHFTKGEAGYNFTFEDVFHLDQITKSPVSVIHQNPVLYEKTYLVSEKEAVLLSQASLKAGIVINIKYNKQDDTFQAGLYSIYKHQNIEQPKIYEASDYPLIRRIFDNTTLGLSNGNLIFTVNEGKLESGFNISTIKFNQNGKSTMPPPECFNDVSENVYLVAQGVLNAQTELGSQKILNLANKAIDKVNISN